MKKILGFSLLIALAFTLTACGAKTTAPISTPTSQPTTTDSATPAATAGSVTIKNFAFTPATITIKAGATVTWTNQDNAPHDIKVNNFNSPLLKTGESFNYQFNTAGTYDYICGVHPAMTGQIIVE
jgi:plastocyanin